MKNIYKFIWSFGSLFRNPEIFHFTRELSSSQKMKRVDLYTYQLEKLQEFLVFSFQHSPYYRQKYLDLGLDPVSNKVTLENLRDYPAVNKTDLLRNTKQIHSEYYFKKLFTCETSGTSGETLVFSRNEEWDSFNRAVQLRGYAWHGVNFWDKNIYLWGYNFSFLKRISSRFLDFIVNRYRLFGFNEVEVDRILQRIYVVKYISGYSSLIYEIAKKLEGRIDRSRLKLRMIKGTSEKIFPHYSALTEKVFGLPIISEYGAAESGIIAFACKNGKMHINMEGVVVEVDSNNEIIVTNLHSHSFPIIRYKLGDFVKLAPNDYFCPCGLQHPVIEEVDGRVGRMVRGKKKEYPSLYFYYIFKNIYFEYSLNLNYQVHQKIQGYLELWLTNEIDTSIEEIIYKEFEKYFTDDIILSINVVENLYRTKGKLSDFIIDNNL